MNQKFPMTEHEAANRIFFENGGQGYLAKPMTFRQFKEIVSDNMLQYAEVEQFHESVSTDGECYRVKDVALSGDMVEIVRHARYSLPLRHNHDYIELIYVYSGKCMHFIEEQSFEMAEGDLCILTPNARHAMSASEDNAIIINIMMSRIMFDASFFSMLKSGKMLSEFFERIFYNEQVSPYILYPTGKDIWLHETVLKMYRERQKKDYLYNESIILLVKQLFIYLIRRYEMMAIVANPISNYQEKNIVGLLGYLTVNYNRTTLKETAEFFGYNETYLGKMLQKYTGKKYCELITELQMNQAKKLLRDEKLSITEIGCEVGCYDASHFNRKFKAAFGMTPKSYRKQCREQKNERYL
ncbi:MAG: AraC family transcriptional regulator [Blautia sp.]|nr:AraC family transcriptional regulator [Blautia sp.]